MDLTRPLALRAQLGSSFALLSGEDMTFGAFMAQGGHGLISVTANVVPDLYVAFYEACLKGDLLTQGALREKLFTLARLLFQAPSPGPLKYALARMGYGEAHTRLPLGPLSGAHKSAIDTLLAQWGLLT